MTLRAPLNEGSLSRYDGSRADVSATIAVAAITRAREKGPPMQTQVTRRRFLAATTAAGVGLTLGRARGAAAEKPALLGGKPVRTDPFPSWPVFDQSEEQALLHTVRSAQWFRGGGKNVNRFEEAYAELMGAKFCVGTSSGTSALLTSLNALGVGPGDEVILPPYTFVACVNAILMLNALPVFVDTDPETFQIDPRKIEAAITGRTAAIMPVHLGGNPASLDAILALARQHKLAVVEDACQAHLAEWRQRKVGTYGDTGCFSFQASKNLTAGEGGAILTANAELSEKCFAASNNSHSRKAASSYQNLLRGANLRMSEFHAGLLMTQMARLPEQTRIREQNAEYLTTLLREIPGILPARPHDGCTRNAYHLYLFRYQQEQFADLPRDKFLKALSAEGIPASAGYTPLNKEPFIQQTLQSRGYRASYSAGRLARWEEQNPCPANAQLCEEGAWLYTGGLLWKRSE